MKVGIVGYGLMGKRRADHMGDDDRIVTIVDPAHPFTPRWSDNGGPGHATEALSECDAVVIATPTPELVHVAAEVCSTVNAGTRFLIEKPCAKTAAQLEDLHANDITIVPGYTLRHYPGVIHAKSLVDANHLGEPMHARMTYGHGGGASSWRAEPNGGGELLDQGSHLLDLAQFFFGPMIVDRAALDHAVTPYVEDNVFMSCTGASSDVHIEIHASWTEWKPTFRVEIFCTDGMITISGLGTATYGQHRLEVRTRREMTSETVYANAFAAAHRNEWEAFKRSAHGGYTQALATLRLIDEARRLDHDRRRATPSNFAPTCDKAPSGWYCSRKHGHAGPCAAWPRAAERVSE